MGVGRFAFTPLLPLMQEEGPATIFDGGVLAAVHFLGYWMGAAGATKLPLSPRLQLQTSLVTIGVCTAGMGMTDDFVAWLVFRSLAGVCSAWALVLVSGFTIVVLADRSAKAAQGWVFSSVGAGITVIGLAAIGFMVTGVTSPPAWLIFGAAALGAACWVCLGGAATFPADRGTARQTGSRRVPLDLRAIIAYGTTGMG
jgi:hypothetical protein